MRLIGYGLTNDLPTFAGQNADEIGRRLSDAGVDGVFLKHHDRAWCEALKASGLKVYGSHTIFMDNDNRWQEIAGCRPITNSGDPAPVQDWYRPLLPTSMPVRELRLAQLSDLLADLSLDGVWLDFIRWPARWESGEPKLYHSSFDPMTLSQFQTETGIVLPATCADATAAA